MRYLCWATIAAMLVGTVLRAQTEPVDEGAAVLSAYPHSAVVPLASQVLKLVNDPSVMRAHWGVAVTALDGTPLFGLDEGKLFRPASNNKVFTTATAMALLGPGAAFTTQIFGTLDAATGTVTGDLTLLGGGDANFGGDDLPWVPASQRKASQQEKNAPRPRALEDLEALADQLVAKGVKSITGDIVGDDTIFPWEPYGDSWAADDLVWGYGAPVSALSIADNQMKLTVSPNMPARLEQNGVPYYTVVSQVRTGAKGEPLTGVQVERLPGSHVVRVYGVVAADAKADVEYLAIDDPAAYAAMALRGMLQQRGILVEGVAKARHQEIGDGRDFLPALRLDTAMTPIHTLACPESGPAGVELASHTSGPLREDVMLTNKISQNLHAELLFRHIGRLGCGGGSILDSARRVRAFLLRAGVDGADFTLYDGSGLSAHDLVTPRALATFLAYAAKQPWFAAWKASLPGGADGSLDTRFPTVPLKGHVSAKTGTLGESRALSGYVEGASGKTVIFSIMVDDHAPGSSADRTAMDKIVAAIAAAN